MSQRILERIEAGVADVRAGELVAGTLRVDWDSAGMRIADSAEPSRDASFGEEDAFSVQISRSRAPLEPSAWQRWTGQVPGHVHRVHVEIRGGTTRALFTAVVSEPSRLEGLPWLARAEGHEVAEADVVALLEAAVGLGAKVASWAEEDTEAVPVGTPNREVSWKLKSRIVFSSGMQFMGWPWLTFSMIFVIVFIPMLDVRGLMFSPDATAKGRVVEVEATSASENEDTVYAHHFEFETESGRTVKGISYSSDVLREPGMIVNVDYEREDPERYSCIQHMRMNTFGPWLGLIVLLFPVIGFFMTFPGMFRGLRSLALIRHGLLTHGSLVSKEPTMTNVNGKQVMKMTFRFTTPDGKEHETVVKTHETARLEDDEFERILYAEAEPSRAVLYDDIPGELDIDEQNQRVTSPQPTRLRYLILPGVFALELGILVMVLV